MHFLLCWETYILKVHLQTYQQIHEGTHFKQLQSFRHIASRRITIVCQINCKTSEDPRLLPLCGYARLWPKEVVNLDFLGPIIFNKCKEQLTSLWSNMNESSSSIMNKSEGDDKL